MQEQWKISAEIETMEKGKMEMLEIEAIISKDEEFLQQLHQ